MTGLYPPPRRDREVVWLRLLFSLCGLFSCLAGLYMALTASWWWGVPCVSAGWAFIWLRGKL